MAQNEEKVHQHRQSIVEEEETDYGKLARMELLKLQRKYRLMENDQRSIAGESGITISRQYRVLNILREQKENLETDVANADSRHNKRIDAINLKFMTELIHKFDRYQADIAKCLHDIDEIEKQVDTITQRVVSQNLKIISLFGQSMTQAQADKRLRILENRLYQKTTKYDTLVSQNIKLRQEISMILQERAAYHNRTIFVKRCNARMKARMIEVVEATTAIYDDRDEYASKIKSIREKDEKESRLHIHELGEIQRVKHDTVKSQAFMDTKLHNRGEFEGEEDRRVRHERMKEQELDWTLSTYKKSFREILELGFTPNIETLCTHYYEAEQSNFAKFQYMNDLHNETEVLKESLYIVKGEIEKCKKSLEEVREFRREMIETAENEVEDNEMQLEEFEDAFHQMQHEMTDFIDEFNTVFKSVGCDDLYKNFLGNQNGMSPENLCLCFKIFENKVDELLSLNAIFALRKSVELEGGSLIMKSVALRHKKETSSGGPYKPQVIISGRIDATDEEGDDEKWLSFRPLGKQDIKNKIMERFAPTHTGTEDSKSSVALDSPSEMSIYRRSSRIPGPIKQLDLSQSTGTNDSKHARDSHFHHHDKYRSSDLIRKLSSKAKTKASDDHFAHTSLTNASQPPEPLQESHPGQTPHVSQPSGASQQPGVPQSTGEAQNSAAHTNHRRDSTEPPK